MALPTDLGTNDAGFLLDVVDYGHLLRWSGTGWEFAPGDDGNGYIRDCLIAPQGAGWALCDGSSTSYLKAGAATVTALSIKTPDEQTTGVYHKSAVATSGTVEPSVGGTITGSTAAEAAHTHSVVVPSQNTADESAHTHSVDPPSTTSGNNSAAATVDNNLLGSTLSVAADTHTHDTNIASFASAAGSAHHHSVGAQTVTSAAGSSHLHGAGTLVVSGGEPAHLKVLRFFRR